MQEEALDVEISINVQKVISVDVSKHEIELQVHSNMGNVFGWCREERDGLIVVLGDWVLLVGVVPAEVE